MEYSLSLSEALKAVSEGCHAQGDRFMSGVFITLVTHAISVVDLNDPGGDYRFKPDGGHRDQRWKLLASREDSVKPRWFNR